jgi:hypothetical protein
MQQQERLRLRWLQWQWLQQQQQQEQGKQRKQAGEETAASALLLPGTAEGDQQGSAMAR